MEFDYFDNVEGLRERRKRFESLLDALFPELKIEKVFGMNRLRWNGHELTVPMKRDKFLSIMVSTSFVAGFVIYRVYSTFILEKSHKFNTFRELPVLLAMGQYWFSCILSVTIHSKRNIEIIKGIYHLDTKLRLNTTDDFYNKERKGNIVVVSFLVTSHVVFHLYRASINDVPSITSVVFLIILSFFQDLELFIFCKLISALKTRLHVLNDQLSKVRLKNRNGVRVVTTDEGDVATKLNFLATLYDDVGEICLSINDVFNFHVLMILTSAFAHTITIQWGALQFYGTKYFAANMERAIIWCARYACDTIAMCFTCERLLSARGDTKALVNELIMDYGLPPRTRRQAKAFLELVAAWDLKVSVYDMFFVDGELIFKLIGVCITYLIVLIQIYKFV